ncbi:MAG TPA: hypothetical protein VN132_11805 [Bdellovibrio sp.]|nr:hypothetical protein [Bdellovibrio sp.]
MICLSSSRIFSAFVVSFFLFGVNFAEAYPEFIGYGYNSCLTCHYNGQGGGPLNDYGRALWSAEIASRAFYPKTMTDEQIAENSGFFGSLHTPDWLRPHIKYRGLELETNPASSKSQTKYFLMQTDMGLTILPDSEGKYLATATWGRVVHPQNFGLGTEGADRFLATEYYLRVEVVQTWWLYAGLMEKVFGLRNIDHTSYQRTYQGFNVQNDTADGSANSQGLVLQKIEEKWDVAVNYFFGNPYDSSQYQQKGLSAMGEFEVGDKKRLGLSVLSESSQVLKKNLAAIHYRQALSKGSAVMAEWGLIQDEPTGSDKAVGSYGLLQSMLEFTRGYNVTTTIEHYNREFKSSSGDNWKWSLGLLMFPAPRFELRLAVVNERQISATESQDDLWSIQGQLHVSL